MPDGIFATLSAVTTFTLVRNTRMGNNLPSSITQTSLQNLFVYSPCRSYFTRNANDTCVHSIVNGQTLTNPLANLASSSSLRSSLKLM